MAAPVAAVTISAPGTSTRPRSRRAGADGITAGSTASTATPTGRLMKNTHGQPAALVSTPQAITPRATPEPPTAAHTPSALLRAVPVNIVVTSDSADGESSAAPAPWATRPPISIAPFTASPLTADAAV